jgi:hypothetical protein
MSDICAHQPHEETVMSKPQSTLFVALVSSAWLVGCAAEPSDTSDEAGSSEAAATSMKFYDCNGGDDGADQMNRIEIGLTTTAFEVTDVSKNAAPPSKGSIDRDYHPSAAYAGAVRYAGFRELAEIWSDVGTVEFVVSPQVQENAATGKVWMRTAGGGGGTTAFWCKSKAKKFAPETARRARLMCDFKLICTEDNPPGRTCLSEAFISQTSANASTLRTSYYDHFGVHAQERRENIGASSSMDRNTRRVTGEWSGHKLDVTYRGGVTYLGTFTLPDGRSTEAQCNDLAMFD